MIFPRKKQVAVMFGGRSVEHEISVITALQLIQAIDPALFEVTPVYIAPTGLWYTGRQLLERSFYRRVPGNLSGLQEVTLLPKPGVGGLTKVGGALKDVIAVDVFLPAFHGQYGEDGCIQGLLELADVPYTGSNVLASAMTMNKYACKCFLKEHGIPVLPALLMQRAHAQRDLADVVNSIVSTPGFSQLPIFVKPCSLGSSIGVSKVSTKEELGPALARAFRYDTSALVEPCVSNLMEINVSVRDFNGVQTSVVEVPVSQSGVLSYEEKYLRGGGKKTGPSEGMASLTRVIDPKDLDPAIKAKAIDLAKRSFHVLGCSGVARLDFINDLSTGQLYFNELNSFPGSCSFYLWIKSQPRILYTTLIENMIETALHNHATAASLDRNIGLKALK